MRPISNDIALLICCVVQSLSSYMPLFNFVRVLSSFAVLFSVNLNVMARSFFH